MVDFSGAEFAGGTVDFTEAADWSHPSGAVPPGAAGAGVRLPAAAGQEPG